MTHSKRVLVAGGLGFLGQYISWGLVRKGYQVILLTSKRADSPLSQRIDRFKYCNTRANKDFRLSEEEFERIDFLESDISAVDFDLDAETSRWLLSQEISQVWNCAAFMRYGASSYEQSYATNVTGALNLAHLASRNNSCSYFHISTAYISGKHYSNGTLIKEKLPDCDAEFFNSYDRTKALAEKKIADACRNKGIPFAIFRPAIIVGDSKTGFTSSAFGFYEYLAAFEQMRIKHRLSSIRVECDGVSPANLIPVDICADCILRIGHKTKVHDGSIFTIADSDPLCNDQILHYLGDIFDVDIRSVKDLGEKATFHERLFRKFTSKNHAFNQREFNFSNKQTRNTLGDDFCSSWPKDRSFIKKLIKGFNRYQKERKDG